MKKLLIILLLFFCIIGYAYGGENTTSYDDAPRIINEDPTKTVVALEDGHLNTSFSNNHKGYCVEYTEQEAHKGDQFTPSHTSHIRNNNTGEDVSQYLKIYFIDHYNETQKDPIVTQHTIWHFTDDFEGWRINKTLIEKIRKSTHKYKSPVIDVEKNNTTSIIPTIIKNWTCSEEEPKHLNSIKHITVPKTGIPTGLLILAIISIPILTYRKQ